MKKRIILLVLMLMIALAGCTQKEQLLEEKEESKEEETDKEEEKKEEEQQEPEYNVDLSKELSSFQFALNGEIYQLPIKLEDMKRAGWVYDGDDTKTIEPESFLESETLKKEGDVMTVDIVNLETEVQPIFRCYAGGLFLEYKKGDSIKAELPGDIFLGQSVLDDVLKAYGNPTDQYEEDDKAFLTYEFGIYKKAEFTFDTHEEILQKVDWENYREPETEEKISDEVPKAVADYQAPEALSEDIRDVTVEYAGALYRMPAPVSEFLKNGWSVKTEGSDVSVKAKKHGYITLEREGQSLYAVVMNYHEKAARIENCFVTSVHGDFENIKVPIRIYKGITLGMSKDALDILMDGTEFEQEEKDAFQRYVYYLDEEKRDSIEILVDVSLGLVREISVSYNPDSMLEGEVQEEAGENHEDAAKPDEPSAEASALNMQDELPVDDIQ